MEKLKKIPQDEVERIANKHEIDVSIIIKILDDWEYYDSLHDSFEAFKELPVPKYDDLWSIIPPKDLAILSLFYHKNHREIERPQPKIFKKVVFTSLSPNKNEDLELSEFAANQIIKVYFEKMAKEYLILDQQGYDADKILSYKKRSGKRTGDKILKRDIMIKQAGFYLKSKYINHYSPIIKDLLSKVGLGELKLGYIRKIIGKS
jgi:hypothetical protein